MKKSLTILVLLFTVFNSIKAKTHLIKMNADSNFSIIKDSLPTIYYHNGNGSSTGSPTNNGDGGTLPDDIINNDSIILKPNKKKKNKVTKIKTVIIDCECDESKTKKTGKPTNFPVWPDDGPYVPF